MTDHGCVFDEPLRPCGGRRCHESFLSSSKKERTAHKLYRSRDGAVCSTIDNPKRRHSTIGYLSPMVSREGLG